MHPPKAKKIRKELDDPFVTRLDYFYWLNQRDDPEVITYLNAENDYTKKMMQHTEALQDEIFNEIISRIKQDDSTVPYKDDGYFYYTRYEEDKEYPVYCRKKDTLSADEEILLNVNEMAAGYNFFNVTALSISKNKKLLSYGVDITGRRQYEIFFKDLTSGKILGDKLSNTTGNAVWANDNKTVFYTLKDEALRGFKIFRHRLGDDSSEDKEIYHEKDESFITYVFKTKSKKYIVISSFSMVASEFRLSNADNPESEFKLFQVREKGLEYSIYHYYDKFYIKTNLDAKNFRVMETSVDKTTKENWKEVIPHRQDVLLEDAEVFNDHLVLLERKDGLNKIRVINQKNNNDYYIDFDEAAYTVYFDRNPEFDSDILRYNYSSLATPNSVIDFNMGSMEKIVLKEDEVVGGYNKHDYQIERLYVDADDQTRIPVSVVYKKGIKKDGNNPLLLYGYGAYGISTEPVFSIARLSLLDRGFIYAIAHVRGGQEMGRYWYEEGKFLKKKNTFTDFINCAEYLIKEKYTSSRKLCAMGGSAGGLLIGAIINMRPELFRAIVAMVPFVDVVTTMLDESLPLTTGEFEEWGNPKQKEYYDYMFSYSPYDNVERNNYPAMLVMTGLHDSQVQYWEPAKWVAKLREFKTDNNLLLLQTNMDAGHGGASGRFRRIKETALEYVFFLDQLNIKEI
jgi:oligopeptidase B